MTSKKPLRKRKAFRLLKLMDPREIQLFASYLRSEVLQATLDTRLLDFWHQCEVTEVWQSDMGREEFLKATSLDLSPNAFDKCVSKLYTHLLGFFGVQAFREDPSIHFPLALNYLLEREFDTEELEKLYARGMRDLSNSSPDARYHQLALDTQLALAKATVSRTIKPSIRNLGLLHENLDAYYLIQKLRFLCASINEQNIYGNSWQQPAADPLDAWFEGIYDTMPQLAKIYFHVYKIFTGGPEADHFDACKELLQSWQSKYGDQDEVADLNGYLMNYYVTCYNEGDLKSLPKVNELYDRLIESGHLLIEGRIRPELFKNIISIKSRSGLHEEARAFFRDYAQLLNDDHDGFAIDYNSVYLDFFDGDLQKVQARLEAFMASSAPKLDAFYGLDLRCLLLKTYFHLLQQLDFKDWDEVDEKLNALSRSFYGYIQRKNISQMTKVRFENYRKALLKLYHLHLKSPTSDWKAVEESLVMEFESSSNLPDKGWFLAQAESLFS